MPAFGLDSWRTVRKKRDWRTILVGNGSSVAVSKSFAYASLYGAAKLSTDERRVFDALETTNFEDVLHHLWSAELICDQLGHSSDEVAARHEDIRRELIRTINAVHVSWRNVNTSDRLEQIRNELREYQAVFTTNYDLIIYWAIMADDSGDGFGDLFWNTSHVFDPFDTDARDDKTIVYWIHGGLHLYRGRWGETVKRVNSGATLLDSFGKASEPALYVSEGQWQRKRRAIRQSDYLEHAYTTFAANDQDLVVFGHSLAAQDRHLATAIRRTPKRRIAFGIHPRTQAQVNREQTTIEELFPRAQIWFFDSTTHPLGDPALQV